MSTLSRIQIVDSVGGNHEDILLVTCSSDGRNAHIADAQRPAQMNDNRVTDLSDSKLYHVTGKAPTC